MNCEEYIPPEPITDNHGLLVDLWLGAHIAQSILDRGSVYLCHTVPEFREVWDRMVDRVTMEGYLEDHNPPGWARWGADVIRAALVLFGDRTITEEWQEMGHRTAALRQSIHDVIDALNRGELTGAIIQETIDERLS